MIAPLLSGLQKKYYETKIVDHKKRTRTSMKVNQTKQKAQQEADLESPCQSQHRQHASHVCAAVAYAGIDRRYARATNQ